MKSLAFPMMLLTLVAFLGGCAPKQAASTPAVAPPTFAWTPPTTAVPASAGVTFALVGATYSENQPWTGLWPFTDFSRNMALDFQQLISARGFTVKGPFGSYDELAYPDKKGSDLVLQPSLDVRVEFSNLQRKENFRLIGDNTYSLEGDAAVTGRVTLALLESLTKERMWFKSIELTPSTVHWIGSKQYKSPPASVDFSDVSVTNPLGKTMEGAYRSVMEATWRYLDPEEMKLVKKQAEEIKAKKVY